MSIKLIALGFAASLAIMAQTPAPGIAPEDKEYMAAQQALADAQIRIHNAEQKKMQSCIKQGKVLDTTAHVCVVPPPDKPAQQ